MMCLLNVYVVSKYNTVSVSVTVIQLNLMYSAADRLLTVNLIGIVLLLPLCLNNMLDNDVNLTAVWTDNYSDWMQMQTSARLP